MCYLAINTYYIEPTSPMNRLLYIILFITLLASCTPFRIYVRINQNGYPALTEQQRVEIRQFANNRQNDTGKYLVEITAKDVYPVLKKNQYTWLHFWTPFCKGENCKPLWYYDKIALNAKSKGLQSMLISNSYSYRSVKSQVKSYSDDVYVIKNAVYGSTIGKNHKAFINDFVEDGYISKPNLFSNLIFKGDSLVYYGSNISTAIVDSVVNATR